MLDDSHRCAPRYRDAPRVVDPSGSPGLSRTAARRARCDHCRPARRHARTAGNPVRRRRSITQDAATRTTGARRSAHETVVGRSLEDAVRTGGVEQSARSRGCTRSRATTRASRACRGTEVRRSRRSGRRSVEHVSPGPRGVSPALARQAARSSHVPALCRRLRAQLLSKRLSVGSRGGAARGVERSADVLLPPRTTASSGISAVWLRLRRICADRRGARDRGERLVHQAEHRGGASRRDPRNRTHAVRTTRRARDRCRERSRWTRTVTRRLRRTARRPHAAARARGRGTPDHVCVRRHLDDRERANPYRSSPRGGGRLRWP